MDEPLHTLEEAGSGTPLEHFETHLSEAGFLWEQRVLALGAPDRTLPQVEEELEHRLLAHLDALALGGRRVARALLIPAAEQEEAGLTFSAAYALLLSEERAALETVLGWLEADANPVRAGVVGALALSPRLDLEPHLVGLLEDASPTVQVALLEALALRGGAPDIALEPLLASEEPDLRCAALRASWRLCMPLDPWLVERELASPDPEVCGAALEAGLVQGLRTAWHACTQQVRGQGPAWPAAARLWAMGCGSEDKLEPLIRALEVPALRRAAVQALGLSGQVAAADLLLEQMEGEALAPLAGEAFSAITGLSLEGDYVFPRPEEETDGDAESPEDRALPLPRAAEVARWWAQARKGFDRRVRYLGGRPFSWESLHHALANGPMRRRPALALELAIRTRGAQQVTVEAWGAHQRREMAELRGLWKELSTRPLELLVGGAPSPSKPRPIAVVSVQPVLHPRPPPPGALAITGLGMVSSLGDGVAHGCASAHAGLLEPCALEDYTVWDEDACELSPLSGHAIPWLALGFRGLARLVCLGSAALRDLLRKERLEPGPRTGLFLTLPSGFLLAAAEHREWKQLSGGGAPLPRPPRADTLLARLKAELVPRLLEQVPVPGGVQHVALFFEDGPGLVTALEAARQALQAGRLDRCLVGGMDGWVEPLSVAALESLRLLKTPDHPVGFVPGEAAAFLLVEEASQVRRRRAHAHAYIEALAHAREPTDIFSGKPHVGEALTGAVRQVLTQRAATHQDIGLVIGSLNGTPARAQDWGYTLIRLAETGLRRAADWHPALHFGETGAASGLLGVCLAARGFARGYAPAPEALLWLWAETGSRAALTLRAPEPVNTGGTHATK